MDTRCGVDFEPFFILILRGVYVVVVVCVCGGGNADLWRLSRSIAASVCVRAMLTVALSSAGNCMGAVAVRVANYGTFAFNVPLELPSSSYYQVDPIIAPHPLFPRFLPFSLSQFVTVL